MSEFLEQARKTFVDCGKKIQMKIPLNNDHLKLKPALDPEVRGQEHVADTLKMHSS